VTLNESGEAITFSLYGEAKLSVADFQRLGELRSLEQLAVNAPPAGDEDWGFLRDLPKLRKLTIWHCKAISSLAAFSDLKIEGLTVGGSMGIRDLNKDKPARQLDAVLSLRGLPNLTYLNLYHSPLLPHDRHLAHIALTFPKLEELKIDIKAPRGAKTEVSPDGLRTLKARPLRTLSIEHLTPLTADHMRAIAEIATLRVVLLDGRRDDIDPAPLVLSLKTARPDLDVQAAAKGDKNPPAGGK
jgi:hypothetical protein